MYIHTRRAGRGRATSVSVLKKGKQSTCKITRQERDRDTQLVACMHNATNYSHRARRPPALSAAGTCACTDRIAQEAGGTCGPSLRRGSGRARRSNRGATPVRKKSGERPLRDGLKVCGATGVGVGEAEGEDGARRHARHAAGAQLSRQTMGDDLYMHPSSLAHFSVLMPTGLTFCDSCLGRREQGRGWSEARRAVGVRLRCGEPHDGGGARGTGAAYARAYSLAKCRLPIAG